MWVKVRTDGLHLVMPVPIKLAGFVIRRLPSSIFYKMSEDVSSPYDELITKETICIILDACLDIVSEHKGLEVVHVDAADGTFVSVIL
ncbi:MAG: hypothetical protein ACOYBE_02490 [Blautia sp.]|jgi:hypothetical protein